MSTSCVLQGLELSSQTEKIITKTKKGSNPFACGSFSSTSKGLLLGIISGAAYSWIQVIVKHLKSIHPAQLTLYRFWAISSFILPHLVLSPENPLGHTNHRFPILIVGISGVGAHFLGFVATRYLPIGEASALVSCYPVFITIVGRIFLKESLGFVQIIALLATIIGVVLISGVYQTVVQNSRIYTAENLYGLAAALCCVIFITIFMSLTKMLVSKNVHHSVIVFIGGVVGVILSIILTALLGNFKFHNNGLEKFLIILLGVLNCVALFSITLASRYAESGPLSTVRAAADIFLSFVWQVAVFNDIPDATTCFGAVLVCTAISLIGFSQKVNAALPDKLRNLC